MSYLDGSFLADGESYDAGDATLALSPALGEDPSANEVAIVLPGGIMISKKALWMILGAVAVAALIVYMKRQRSTKAIED